MPFGLVSAWNKRRRSKSHDSTDPWIYKPAEYWQLEDQTPQPAKRHHGSSIFILKEMEEATNSFSDENLLGKGGFGRVYRGTLRSGEVVAIKKMELPPFKAAEGEHEFRVEVDILSRLDHPNLVSLIGYCADGKHRFLVYEYMHNGNLQQIGSLPYTLIQYKQGEAGTSGSPPSQYSTQLDDHCNLIGLYPGQ